MNDITLKQSFDYVLSTDKVLRYNILELKPINSFQVCVRWASINIAISNALARL
jgi:hypothetical protein